MRYVFFLFIILGITGNAWADINQFAYKDRVYITDDKLFVSTDGMQVRCSDLARLGSNLVGALDGILVDGFTKKKESYSTTEGMFGTPYVKWTATTVDFLKTSIDECAGSNGIGRQLLGAFLGNQGRASMSPQMAKDVVDQIYVIASATNAQATRLAEARQRQAEEKEAKERELSEYIAKVRSGDEKIKNIDDALYFYTPAKLEQIIASPLITPDGNYYAGRIVLDQQTGKNQLRGKIMNYVDMASRPPRVIAIGYVNLLTGKAKVFDGAAMRLEGQIRVIGRYVSNAQYQTVLHEEKTSPVLEVLYLGK